MRKIALGVGVEIVIAVAGFAFKPPEELLWIAGLIGLALIIYGVWEDARRFISWGRRVRVVFQPDSQPTAASPPPEAEFGDASDITDDHFRLRVTSPGRRLAAMVTLSGTGESERPYYAPWRLFPGEKFAPVGKAGQDLDIARGTFDKDALWQAAYRKDIAKELGAAGLDFLSPTAKDGYFTRQVRLDGSLTATVSLQTEDGEEVANDTFKLILDSDGDLHMRGSGYWDGVTPR